MLTLLLMSGFHFWKQLPPKGAATKSIKARLSKDREHLQYKTGIGPQTAQ